MAPSGGVGRREAAIIVALITGAAVGALVTVACAPAGATLRRTIGARTGRLTRDATAIGRRANDRVAELRVQGSELVQRLRTAAREGIREARRHLVVVREPPRAGLTGVEGLADGF